MEFIEVDISSGGSRISKKGGGVQTFEFVVYQIVHVTDQKNTT